MPALALLIVGGAFAMIGGVVYWVYRVDKARTEAMRMTAQTMGFAFEEQITPEALGAFPLMERGRSRRGKNVMRGTLAGEAATLCDYRYTVQSGKNSHTVSQTVAVFSTPRPGLPDFELTPENVLHRFAAVFGYQDIDFDGHEEFSKAYLLRGGDEDAIRRAFDARVLMHFAAHPGWSVQASAGRLLVFRAGKQQEPATVPSFAADALRIAGAFGAAARSG